MTIQSSMFSGISGLNAAGSAMAVIGNNIANANTIGFKSGRVLFSDLISVSAATANTSQVGRGAQSTVVDNIFSQGTFENTESNTDLAIEGDGFFIVREASNTTNLYTRAGGFRFDEEGYLTTPSGERVQGYALDANANTVGDITDIQVATTLNSTPTATDAITLKANLNADSTAIATGFDAADPTGSSHFAISSTVFDTLGESHVLTTYFTKTAASTWEANVTVDGGEVTGGTAGTPELLAEMELTFDANGKLGAGSLVDNGAGAIVTADTSFATEAIAWNNGSTDTGTITYTIADQTTTPTTSHLTQYSSTSSVASQTVNGNGAGSLASLSIDNDGNVIVTHSTGDPEKEFRIAMARFPNPQGLSKKGENLYSATDDSGDPTIGTPGSGVGKIFTYSLEQSNVDLAQEFVRMITTQRTFQANSRIITTTDEMLAELINLKR